MTTITAPTDDDKRGPYDPPPDPIPQPPKPKKEFTPFPAPATLSESAIYPDLKSWHPGELDYSFPKRDTQ